MSHGARLDDPPERDVHEATAPSDLSTFGSTAATPSPGTDRRFWIWLVAITLVGLGIRVATVLGRPNRKPGGDAYYFHNAANLLVAGHGFVDPWLVQPQPPPDRPDRGLAAVVRLRAGGRLSRRFQERSSPTGSGVV